MLMRALAAVLLSAMAWGGSSAWANEATVPGVVCYAKDRVKESAAKGHHWVHYYFRGEGICLSHAKGAALERCYYSSKDKSTCNTVDDECYDTMILEPKR